MSEVKIKRYTDPQDFQMKCDRGHTWNAHMEFDIGGWIFTNPFQAQCPICKQIAPVAENYLTKEWIEKLNRRG